MTSLRSHVVVIALVVIALAASPAGAQDTAAGPMVTAAAGALRADPVFVHPHASSILPPGDADRVRERIEQADAGPIYVAVFPEEARSEGGGSAEGVATSLVEAMEERATYAVVVGTELRVTSSWYANAEGVSQVATRAVQERSGQSAAAVLTAFVDGLEGLAQGQGAGDGGSGIGFIPLLLLVGGGFLLMSSLRKRRAQGAERRRELEEVKRVARDDLIALGEDLRAFEIDVAMPDADPAAKADYERALASYELATTELDRARRPEDVAAVSSALEDGRYAMASARARLEGRPPPERRAPCFFDPRHGPSDRDVEWAPPGGAPRTVPACDADARRVELGEEPHTRSITVGGRERPYYDAPAYYGPWAGGYFGGFGLFEGFLLGSWLSGGFGFGGFGGDDGGGDADGGSAGDFGDFGGGDFGGGDFGGGDFGGGDFGGG